ncbi:MAG: CvpA family protein, partial [Sphingomonadales bacterium]|nr:CvpA family protein [Sphingomonadales bacterium]
MTALDGIVLILVGGGAVRGGFRGFTYEAATLAAWVLGIVALRLFFTPVANWLADGFASPGFAAVIAFA